MKKILVHFMPLAPLKNGAEGILYSGLFVRECMREFMRPENLVNTTSQKRIEEIPPSFGHKRPRAFQRAIDGLRTLSLSFLKGGSKAFFVFFK